MPPAFAARQGGIDALAAALQASRHDTLTTFAAYEQALPGLRVPLHAERNPPLWELGHIGWFQEYWLARNPERHRGVAADPECGRSQALQANADALYNSSKVPHDARWDLPLPGAEATRDALARQLAGTLALLRETRDGSDDALYFFRLALLHEDMHHEAALDTAQALGIAVEDARWQAATLPKPSPPIDLPTGPWRLGSDPDTGFVFDNELPAHDVALGATTIDAQVVRWIEFLPFLESGGYADDSWWSAAGRPWRAQLQPAVPRYLRRAGSHWQQWRHGQWQALNLAEAACHLTFYEAEAWCRWAGRRLPSEAEWERAAVARPEDFRWGHVWEWMASPFQPYPGFAPHPYRDYSAPWFDDRPVLRGASHMTQPRLRHARYRNFFPPHRNDIAAGFRSCAA